MNGDQCRLVQSGAYIKTIKCSRRHPPHMAGTRLFLLAKMKYKNNTWYKIVSGEVCAFNSDKHLGTKLDVTRGKFMEQHVELVIATEV